MAGTFSKYQQVATNYAFSTPSLVGDVSYEDIGIANASFVPVNPALACTVEVSIIRNSVSTVILRESLAAGDKLYDTTLRVLKPNDFYNVVVSTPCDISIVGTWS